MLLLNTENRTEVLGNLNHLRDSTKQHKPKSKKQKAKRKTTPIKINRTHTVPTSSTEKNINNNNNNNNMGCHASKPLPSEHEGIPVHATADDGHTVVDDHSAGSNHHHHHHHPWSDEYRNYHNFEPLDFPTYGVRKHSKMQKSRQRRRQKERRASCLAGHKIVIVTR